MNILLTSVGRRSYMVGYFKDALAGTGEVHAANSDYTYAMQQADKHICTPLIYDERYIGFLLDYCIKTKISAVIPLFDIDLPVLSQARYEFARQGIQVVVSNYETTQICNDKWRTHNFLMQKGIGTPISFISMNECLGALEKGIVSFPLTIKPRWGMGSIGIYHAEAHDELRIFYNKLKREVFSTYLKYESGLDAENCVLIQEKLIGEEFGIDVFNDLDGDFLTAVPKKKIAMRSGETDSAIVLDDHRLLALGRTLSHSLGHVANLDVDCFIANSALKVLEMNCRFGGQYPFSHLAGVNFPLAIVKMLQGDYVPEALLKARMDVMGVKYLKPELLDGNYE